MYSLKAIPFYFLIFFAIGISPHFAKAQDLFSQSLNLAEKLDQNKNTIELQSSSDSIQVALNILKIWYQQVAYKEVDWQLKTLNEVRQELLDNPYFPRDLALLIPASTAKVSTYLKGSAIPALEDWQNRMYKTHQEVDVAIKPTLNTSNFRDPVATAPDIAAQQAKAVYASDSRLGLNIDETSILRGLASFIEERAQEELNVVFLDRFRKQLEKSTILQGLFPYTTQLFEQFELDNYRFLMDNAKIVFTADLKNLGLNIYSVFEEEEFKGYFNYSTGLYFTALVLKMINMVYEDIPTDTVLVNAYLSLYNQSVLLEQEVNRQTAISLLKNDQQLSALQNRSQQYFTGLKDNADSLSVLLNELKAQADTLLMEIPDTNKLNAQTWIIGDNIQSLLSNLKDWNKEIPFLEDSLSVGLKGYYPPQYVLDHPDIDKYKIFFPPNNIDTIAILASGLNRIASNQLEITTYFLKDWTEELASLEKQLLEVRRSWNKEKNQELVNRGLLLSYTYASLIRALKTEIDWWSSNISVDNNRHLLALEFLQATLKEDTETENQLSILFNSLFENTPDQALLKKRIDTLENAFNKEYLPYLKQNIEGLKSYAEENNWNKTASIPQDLSKYFASWSANYSKLKEMRDNSVNADTAKVFLFENNQSVISGQKQIIDNPFVLYLDTLSNFQYYDSLNASPDNVNIGYGIYNLQNSINTTLNEGLGLKKWLNDYEKNNTDTVIISSKDKVKTLSRVMEVGVHMAYALKYNKKTLKSSNSVDTMRIRSSLMVQDTNSNVLNIQDSISIRSKVKTDTLVQKWLSLSTMDSIFRSDTLAKSIYYGLLYQDIATLRGFQSGNLDHISSLAQNVALLSTTTLQSIEALYELEQKRKNLKEKGEKLSPSDYTELIRETLKLVWLSFELFKDQDTPYRSTLLSQGESILNQTAGLYQNLVDDQYNMAISNLAALVQALVTDNQSTSFVRGAEKFKAQVLNYGSFMAAVALAQNPEQVKTALETAAVDVGYSRVKRVNSWNGSINAYLGLSLGFENRGSSQSGALLSLSTPIGISISKGLGKGNSLSLFGSILDIGPLVTYDFSSGQSQTDNLDLSFNDFIAPGGFLFWNIANTPFTVGAGIQRPTRLRKIGESTTTTRTTRVLGSILIDVPIFNLFTRKY